MAPPAEQARASIVHSRRARARLRRCQAAPPYLPSPPQRQKSWTAARPHDKPMPRAHRGRSIGRRERARAPGLDDARRRLPRRGLQHAAGAEPPGRGLVRALRGGGREGGRRDERAVFTSIDDGSSPKGARRVEPLRRASDDEEEDAATVIPARAARLGRRSRRGRRRGRFGRTGSRATRKLEMRRRRPSARSC